MATLFAKKKRVKSASAGGNKRPRPSPLEHETARNGGWSGNERDSSCNRPVDDGVGIVIGEGTGDRSGSAR